MKIRLREMWMNNPKGTEMDIAEGQAVQMINRGVAEAVYKDERPKKRSGMKKHKQKRKPSRFIDKEHNKMMQESPVSK